MTERDTSPSVAYLRVCELGNVVLREEAACMEEYFGPRLVRQIGDYSLGVVVSSSQYRNLMLQGDHSGPSSVFKFDYRWFIGTELGPMLLCGMALWHSHIVVQYSV